jgi:hypothetical protein
VASTNEFGNVVLGKAKSSYFVSYSDYKLKTKNPFLVVQMNCLKIGLKISYDPYNQKKQLLLRIVEFISKLVMVHIPRTDRILLPPPIGLLHYLIILKHYMIMKV